MYRQYRLSCRRLSHIAQLQAPLRLVGAVGALAVVEGKLRKIVDQSAAAADFDVSLGHVGHLRQLFDHTSAGVSCWLAEMCEWVSLGFSRLH